MSCRTGPLRVERVLTHLFTGFASPFRWSGFNAHYKSCHPERSAAKSKDLHFAGTSTKLHADQREAHPKE